MKYRIILLLLVLAGVAQAKPAASPARVMSNWYATFQSTWGPGDKDIVDSDQVFLVGRDTERFARKLNLQAHVPTMLCMWHRESNYDPTLLSPKDCYGVSQLVLTEEPRWRKFWAKRKVYLGPIDDPTTQVAFGVAEYYRKLRRSRGNVYLAVRRYNGRGPAAKEYARRVFMTRKMVFKQPLPPELVPGSGKHP